MQCRGIQASGVEEHVPVEGLRGRRRFVHFRRNRLQGCQPSLWVQVDVNHPGFGSRRIVLGNYAWREQLIPETARDHVMRALAVSKNQKGRPGTKDFAPALRPGLLFLDRKSTRLNSS